MTPNIPPTRPEYIQRIIISLLLTSLHVLYTPIQSITSGNTLKWSFPDIEEVWKICDSMAKMWDRIEPKVSENNEKYT